MTLKWEMIEQLPEFQNAPIEKQRRAKEAYSKFYMKDAPEPERRNFVTGGLEALQQGVDDRSLLEKAADKLSGLLGFEEPIRRSQSDEGAKARATVELQAREEGIPVSEYREGPRLLEQFAGGMTNAMGLGLPNAARQAVLGENMNFEPSSSGEQIAGGLGELAGFIGGAAGGVTGAVGQQIASRLPQASSLAGRAAGGIMAQAPALGAGFATRQVGEAIQEKSLTDAAESMGKGTAEGVITGTIFGGAGAIPNRIARIATGLVALEAQKQTGPSSGIFDDRPISEKAYDIAQNIYFLWKGHGPKVLNRMEAEMGKPEAERKSAQEILQIGFEPQEAKQAEPKAAPAQEPQQQRQIEGPPVPDQYAKWAYEDEADLVDRVPESERELDGQAPIWLDYARKRLENSRTAPSRQSPEQIQGNQWQAREFDIPDAETPVSDWRQAITLKNQRQAPEATTPRGQGAEIQEQGQRWRDREVDPGMDTETPAESWRDKLQTKINARTAPESTTPRGEGAAEQEQTNRWEEREIEPLPDDSPGWADKELSNVKPEPAAPKPKKTTTYIEVKRNLGGGKLQWEAYTLDGELVATGNRIAGKGSVHEKLSRRTGEYVNPDIGGYTFELKPGEVFTEKWYRGKLKEAYQDRGFDVPDRVAEELKARDETQEQPAPEQPPEKPKQPWEMTLLDFAKSRVGPETAARLTSPDQVGSFRAQHKKDVDGWIREGKPIPPEVLAEYPDLAPKEPEPQPDSQITGEAEVVTPDPAAPPQSKKEKSLAEYNAYVASLDDAQRKQAGNLIQDNPWNPGLAKRAIEKRLAGKVEPVQDAQKAESTPEPKPAPTPGPAKPNVDRMRANAEALKARAEAKFSQDRQENTQRRARMASGAREDASKDIQTAKTMLKIADAIDSGTVKYLGKVRSKPDIETLEHFLLMARTKKNRARGLSYSDELSQKGSPYTSEDIVYAEYPEAKANYYEEARGRLKKLGINDTDDLKDALTELVDLRAGKIKEDPVKALERELIGNKGVGIDFFPTPPGLAARIAEMADIKPGDRVLEPSAGKGDLADAVKAAEPGAQIDTVEISDALRKILKAKGHEVVEFDFDDYAPGPVYDKIVMNPPFSKGRDAAHVRKAYDMLKPGGKLIAITGEHPFFANDKASVEFREWLDTVGGTSEKLEGAFQGKDAFRTTGVSSRLVEIEKGNPIEYLKDQQAKAKKKTGGGTTLYSGIPIHEAWELLKKFTDKFYVGVKEQDATLYRQLAGLPSWTAKKHPKEFGPLFDIVNERQLNKTIIRNGYLKDLLPAWKNLTAEDTKKVGDILWRGDKLGKVLNESGLAKLSPAARKAYEATREVLDYIWKEDRIMTYRELFPEESESEIQEMRNLAWEVPGYMLHDRKGKWFISAKNRAGEKLWNQHFDDITRTVTRGNYGVKTKMIEKKVREMFPDASDIFHGKVTRVFAEDGYFDVSPQITEELINAAMKRVKGEDVSKEDFDHALKQAVADVFMARGFMSHGIQRSGVEGFDTSNWQQSVLDYVSGWAGYKSKMIAAQKVGKKWGGIDWTGKEGLRQYADKYIRDAFRNEDNLDRLSAKVRSALFFKFLGGVVKSAVVNLTQTPASFWPRLSVETKWSTVKIAEEIGKASADIVKAFYTEPEGGASRRETTQAKRLSEEERRGITKARQDGTINDQLTEELMGDLPGKYGSVVRGVADAMKWMFGQAEKFNREVAYITSFRVGKERGYTFEKADEFARDMIRESHFQYGKFNLPPFGRGQGKAPKIARAMYTFRSYSHNMIEMYMSLATDHSTAGKVAILKSLGAIALIGGIGSLPFFETIEEEYHRLTGKNIRSEIKKKWGEWATYINYGLPGLFGVDLSTSLGQDIPKNAIDILGAPTAFWQETSNMIDDIKKGDIYRAVEDAPIMPSAVRNVMKADRLGDRGLETRGGKPILDSDFDPVKLNKAEQVGQAIGFQPARVSEEYRQNRAQQVERDIWDKKKQLLGDRYRIADRKGDTDKILDEISKFNEERPDYIAPVTIKTIRQWIINKPSKREVLMEEGVR